MKLANVMNLTERSYEIVTKDDLKRLLSLAQKDMVSFFKRNPRYKFYEDKECLVALGQGSALHYIDQKNGVKDFDVWFFFFRFGDLVLPYRRRGIVDFGESKFGRHPDDGGFEGRRIDVLMRSDYHFNQDNPEQCLKNYLSDTQTKTAQMLSQKAMIGLYPDQYFGKVLWGSNTL